ncbi:MAG TPA: VWA domain-containing protein [Thermoanaerobaculia bacterium]|nr:VWA domain-containing protein [Thermoanaerobaculia bacterium]
MTRRDEHDERPRRRLPAAGRAATSRLAGNGMSAGRFAACLGVLGALGLGALAVAAPPAPAPAPPKPAAAARGTASAAAAPGAAVGDDFVETVTVNVVNVDVYVVDKKTRGRATGLTKNDFELYEDGRPMAITNFYAVEGGKGVAPPAGPPSPSDIAPKEPAERAAPLDRVPVPEDQRLRLVVYIDNFNLKPFDRNKVMRAVRIFLDQKVRRDDQVELVTYDRSLHIRQPFTSDPSLVNSQLVEIEKISAQGVHEENDRRDTLRQIDESKSPSEAVGYARSYAGSVSNDLSFSIDALKNVVTSLAGLSGRKAILYVSDGLPMIAGEDLFYAVQNKFTQQTSMLTETSEFDSSRRFEELASQANASRVTFYTIDAGGLRVYSSTSAENATAGQGVFIDQIRISNMQSTLQMMAEKTGGVAVINANEVMPHLERIAEDFNSFYSLGYSPPHFGDGRYHKINIKLKKKGLEARFREGYRDKTVESRMTDGTLASLQFPFQSNPLGIAIDFGKASQRNDGFWVVPVNIKIPLGRLTLVPRGKTSEARVRLFIGAMDPDGGTSEVSQVPVPISVPEAEVPKIGAKHFVYTMSLLMRGGDQKVAVGMRDDVAAQESYVTGVLRVGRY